MNEINQSINQVIGTGRDLFDMRDRGFTRIFVVVVVVVVVVIVVVCDNLFVAGT